MTIMITGNDGDFILNIVTDGEKCSIVEQEADNVRTRFGKISITEKEPKISIDQERIKEACCRAFSESRNKNIVLF